MEPPKEEGKPDPPNQTPHAFQSIVCMPQYANYSFEVGCNSTLQADPLADLRPHFQGAAPARLSSESQGADCGIYTCFRWRLWCFYHSSIWRHADSIHRFVRSE